MRDDESESDPEVARHNAQVNFERLLAGVPKDIQERENRLAEDLAKVSGSAIKKLRLLYRAMDEITQAVAPFVACRSGCMSCCHYTVHLYSVEVEFIENRTGYKRLPVPEPAMDFHGTPCPFLNQGICGIYDNRPMSCRQHVALTNSAYWCHPDRAGAIQLPMAKFSSAQEAFEGIIQKDGRTQSLDIRQAFGSQSRF